MKNSKTIPAIDEVFVGIDWGASHHQLCAVNAAGQRVRQVRLGHDVAGLERLDVELAQLGGGLPICLERSEGLLVERLQNRGHRVFPVNPRIAARARERYRVASSKDDVFDAFTLADTLRHEHAHWRVLPVPSPALAELRALSRDRDRLLESQQRVEAQLHAILDAYHPAPTQLFSSIDRDITLAFIADYPTPQAAARIGEQRMAAFCRRQSYRGRVDPAILTQRLKDNLLSGSEGTVAGKEHSAQVFAELLGLLNRQLAEYDKRLELALATHPDAQIFLSFPGVGLLTATTLLAEIGEDRDYYSAVGMLLAEAGLAPVTRSSGRSHRVAFRYAANTRLREACMWWAYNSLKTSPWARAAYDDARARKQPHHRALRGLAARWMRVLWRAWTDGVCYDQARHLKTGPTSEDITADSSSTPAAA
jgi:transposase